MVVPTLASGPDVSGWRSVDSFIRRRNMCSTSCIWLASPTPGVSSIVYCNGIQQVGVVRYEWELFGVHVVDSVL